MQVFNLFGKQGRNASGFRIILVRVPGKFHQVFRYVRLHFNQNFAPIWNIQVFTQVGVNPAGTVASLNLNCHHATFDVPQHIPSRLLRGAHFTPVGSGWQTQITRSENFLQLFYLLPITFAMNRAAGRSPGILFVFVMYYQSVTFGKEVDSARQATNNKEHAHGTQKREGP